MKTFETVDLEFAAALLACGHKLHSVEIQDNGSSFGTFFLKLSEGLSTDAASYIDGTLLVNPVGFAQCIKKLKKDTQIAAAMDRARNQK